MNNKTSRNDFLNNSVKALGEIYDMIEKLPSLRLEGLDWNQTALVIIDMVDGFCREGALKSERVEGIIPEISRLSQECEKFMIQKIAFYDCHTAASPEFDAYPAHCIEGTTEIEIVNEIKVIGGYALIPKNSTNGFLEKDFQKWLIDNMDINTFIITGNCTDICIQQYVETLKAWFNMQNKKARIIVPVNAVETYNLGAHDGDLSSIMALYNMIINGIEVVRSIE